MLPNNSNSYHPLDNIQFYILNPTILSLLSNASCFLNRTKSSRALPTRDNTEILELFYDYDCVIGISWFPLMVYFVDDLMCFLTT